MKRVKSLQRLKVTLFIILITALVTAQAVNAAPVWHANEEGKKAVFILPFEEVVPLYTQGEITEYLSSSGYSIDVFRDENVTVELMKHILCDYDVIIIKTFKNDYKQEYTLLTGEKIVAGNICHEQDITEGRVNLGYFYTYELTEDFFNYYYDIGILEGKLIYVIAAKSTFMLNIFKNRGARLVVGYSKDVSLSWGWCDLIAEYFFRYMSFGYSAGESINIINRRLHPANNYIYSNLAVTYMGDASFRLE